MIHQHSPTPAFGDEVVTKVYDHRIAMRLLGYLGPFKARIGLSLLCLLTASAASLAGPYLIKLAIDSAIGQKDLAILDTVIAVFVVAQLANWGASYGQTYLMSWVGQNIIFQLRQQLFDHLQQLSFSFYDRTGVGRLMSRLQNDVNALQDLLTSGIISVVGDVATLLGIVIVMLSMNPSLSLLAFTVLPLMVLVAVLWQGRARRTYRTVRQAIADVNGALQEDLSGIRVVQSFSREEHNLADFKEVNQRNLQANVNSAVLSGIFYPTSDLMAAIATGLVIWYGGSQVLHLQLTAGELVAFILYVGRFFDPIRDISQRYDTVQSAMAAGERIFELADAEPDIVDPPDAVEIPNLRGDVKFEHVSFGYNSTIVLHDVTLEAKAGETIAFVGETGAGKSSLINLIGRFYDIREGRITIDGIDLHRISLRSLRRQLGVVSQDIFLFSGTIADNIRYGRIEASDAEVEAAARVVSAHEFITKLPQGYQTEVQERGSKLSSGQRQLIAFARAILADPRILILDEATANVDTQTERLIQDALRRLLAGRTSFVIAHRLSTIVDADVIMVIHDGRIVERGTHEDLLQQRGRYFELYTAQARELA